MAQKKVQAEIDWSRIRHWQVWDPLPPFLDESRLNRILKVQVDTRIKMLQAELSQMQQVKRIVAGPRRRVTKTAKKK